MQIKNIYYLIILCVLTIITYNTSLKNDFTNWDDDDYVTENKLIKSHPADSLNAYFTKTVSHNYHPITIISLGLDYASAKLSPKRYHVVNLLFHLLNSILVFYLLLNLLKSIHPFVIFIGSAIFAIHPMHVESVAWISERKDVLYVFFYLAGLLLYLKYLDNKKLSFYVFVGALFILSCLSKAMAVTFPIVLFLVDYLQHRKITSKTILEKIPFLVIAVIIGLKAYNIQLEEGAVAGVTNFSFVDKLFISAYGFSNYIIKFIIPFDLAAYHPYPIDFTVNGNLPSSYMAALVFGIACLGAIFYFRKNKTILVGFLFFIVNIVLVIQFISVGSAVYAERYTYLSYIGLIMMLLVGLNYFYKKYEKPVLILSSIGILAFSYLSYNQIKTWENSEVLWTNVISKHPDDSYIPYKNRSIYYLKTNQYNLAKADVLKAITFIDVDFETLANAGNFYFQDNKIELAIDMYTKSIAQKPNYNAYYNRGQCYLNLGKQDLANQDINAAMAYKQ